MNEPIRQATPDDLMEWLKENGYDNLRTLADGTIVGTLDLLYTRALIIGMDRWGWERRYCYHDREQATQACREIASGDAQPLPGFVAQR